MPTLSFESLQFIDDDKTDKEMITVKFLKFYTFTLPKAALTAIAPFKIDNNTITFNTKTPESQVRSTFNMLLAQGFNNLTNILTKHPTTYINRFSNMPLFGSLFFGIVDKGTTMVEVKPLTGCNMNCIFCSVDEGSSSKKTRDVVVEKDYLLDELRKLMDYKLAHDKETKIDIYINPHGEPTLYADLVPLIAGMSAIKGIRDIVIITNGCLLTKQLIDDMHDAGLTSINLSLHSMDEKNAASLFGVKAYPVKTVLENILYAKKKMKVFISPVLVSSMNKEDITEIVKFCKEHNITNIGIQNFLHNRQGRNPAKELPWEEFTGYLKDLEKTYDVKLLIETSAVKTPKTAEYPTVLKKDQVIKVIVMSHGRYENDYICVTSERSIYLPAAKKPHTIGSQIKIKITRALHNTFFAVEI